MVCVAFQSCVDTESGVCIAIPSCVDIENGACSYPIMCGYLEWCSKLSRLMWIRECFFIFHIFIVFSYNRFTYRQQVGII
jgi:hypothetical protein